MIPPPFSLQRLAKSLSIDEKTNSDIFSILLLYGKTFDPAGIMWSVVILSSSEIITFDVNSFPIGVKSGKFLIFGPITTSPVPSG